MWTTILVACFSMVLSTDMTQYERPWICWLLVQCNTSSKPIADQWSYHCIDTFYWYLYLLSIVQSRKVYELSGFITFALFVISYGVLLNLVTCCMDHVSHMYLSLCAWKPVVWYHCMMLCVILLSPLNHVLIVVAGSWSKGCGFWTQRGLGQKMITIFFSF